MQTDHTETATWLLDMSENKQRQRAEYILRNFKKTSSPGHYNGLIQRIREIKREREDEG